MSEAGHDLHSAFPGKAAAFARLKAASPHFRSLVERYHDVAREIHRIESGIEPTSDERLETLKKERLRLLDTAAAAVAAEGAVQ